MKSNTKNKTYQYHLVYESSLCEKIVRPEIANSNNGWDQVKKNWMNRAIKLGEEFF